MTTEKSRRIALFLFKLALSVTLLTLIVHHLGSARVVGVFVRANHWLLLLGVVGIVSQTALSSLKWKILLRQQGNSVPYLALLRAYLISNFINLFVPSVLGGDAYRATWLRQHTGGMSAALPSIVLDRVTGLIALALLATIGLTLLFARTHFLTVLGLALIIGASACFVIVGPLGRWALSRPPGFLFGPTGAFSQIVRGIRPSPTFAFVLALSLVFQLNTVLINWLYSVATDIDVALRQLLVIVPAVYMVEMLPLSINGLGLREGAFAVLFAKAGLLAEHGLILGLTVSVMRYVAGLVGGVLLAVAALRRKDPALTRADAQLRR